MQNGNYIVDRLIRFSEVRQICGLSRSSLWRLQKENKFPQSKKISARACAWSLAEILDWIETKKNSSSNSKEK